MKKDNDKMRLKLKGALKAYMQWPVWLVLLLLCMVLSIYVVDKKAAGIMMIYTAVYFIIALILFIFKRPFIMGELVRFAADHGQVQHSFVKELDIPYGIIDLEGRLVWANNELKDIVKYEKTARSSIQDIFEELSLEQLPTVEEDVTLHIVHGRKNYRVLLRLLDMSDYRDDMPWMLEDEEANVNTLIGMYLYDETEINALKKENTEERMLVGLLYIDNYEEAFEGADEVRRSLVTAWVEREINKYMQSIDAIIKRLEKDKYIFVFKQKYLSVIEANRFSILEEIRNLNIYEMQVTISIGVGVGASTYNKNYELARTAIDLALGRGGDQAVVKEGDKISYYGGKSVQMEKNTRVKARVKAHALKEYVETKEKVIIMGHSYGDIDSLGSAIGIYRIAKTLGKKAQIVINEVTSSIRPMLERFQDNPDYEEDMFISGSKAQEIVNDQTLLVVVDVNRPAITECKELLELTKTIVILDHHRQTGEAIENAVLSYIEPYASSACEMVAEISQYIGEGLKLKPLEADAMYAGIMIDTNNFLMKTGVRTFEAAAYLRRNGADVTRIRKLFRTNFIEYQAKAQAVSTAEIFMEYYVFAVSESEGLDSPSIVAAQTANELLNIDHTKASFVFTEHNGRVHVSARSIDELNVQVVMEKLNGGGHMSAAAVQLADCTVEEAMEKVKEVLRDMTEKGEI